MSSVKKQIINGVMWSGMQKYSGMAVSLIVSAILARLLTPEEFGVVAIANVLIWFFSMFATMGIGPAIIQRKDLTQDDLNIIFSFTFIIGGILGLFSFLSSWGIASWYENDRLVTVCQLLALSLFLNTINMVPGALMSKNLRFKENAILTLVIQIITGIISVIAAYKGLGVYALLISPILTPIGTFIYNVSIYPVRLSCKYSSSPLKKIFSFSAYQFLFELFNYFSRNIDKIIIGKFIGLTDLGYYEKSYRLMQLPIQNVSFVISPVLQPILSNFQNDKIEIARKHDKMVKFIATISFPATIILFFCAYELIHLFYGGNWDNAIPTFEILCFSVAFQMILSTSGSIFQSCNNTKAQFWVGVRNTITTVLGFIIAAIWFNTITAIAWAWLITLIINFICTYYIMYKFIFKTSIIPIIIELKNPFINAVLLFIAGTIIAKFIIIDNIIIMLIIKSTILIILSLLYIQLSRQYNIVQLIKSRKLH